MQDRRWHEPGLDQNQGDLPGAFSGVVRLGYPLQRGRWDEMATEDGSLRPAWNPFINGLTALPPDELESRWEGGQRLIRENGVTYNVYGDPRGLDRPWQLDPVPMIIDAAEWQALERGMIQRALVLNAVLADLYGPQHLLAEGLLPPGLVFSHPSFLRPLRNVATPGGVHLHLYAADLARAPDGSWQVVSDRTEAPSGAGYALENRVIISRTLADLQRDPPVQPLTPFFHKLRESLAALSPRQRDNPRTVLLTPGPYNETYFEHAYLARHLGYTLVEAEDLTMRDGQVFLKTLDGLQPVDVILRRTDGSYCDPLELRSDSSLGIAGLVQAVRTGAVAVANSLGSGVLEGGALSAFMPALCRRLLGEDLKMASTPSWWCGDAASRGHVLDNLGNLVIKAALPGRGGPEPIFGERLSPERKAALAAEIRRQPQNFLAQDHISLSTAPVWSNRRLDSRPVMMRVYLAAHNGGYVMMPGGLTRVAAERGGYVVSMQLGGGSKDTWVLSDPEENPQQQARQPIVRTKLVRGSRDLPSRVADNFFWLGRQIERTEDTTRMLRAVLSRADSQASFGAAEELPVALGLLNGVFHPNGDISGTADQQALELARMNFDGSHSSGLRANVERVHRMASLARDRLSPDTWRAVNRLLETVRLPPARRLTVEEPLNACNNIILACEALSGLAMENMTRGLSWRFIDIGRRVERAVHVQDLLSGICLQKNGTGTPAMDVLLEISDSTMTYRSRYLATPQFAPVLDLLLADESNPRSLAFQTAALGAHMDHLAQGRRGGFYGPDQRMTIWLTGAVRTADIDVLARPDEDGGRRVLATFLEVLRSKLWELSETVTREYFTHAVSRTSAATLREPLQ